MNRWTLFAAPLGALAVIILVAVMVASIDTADERVDVHRTPMGDGTVCYVVVNGKGDPRGIDCLRADP